MAPKKLRLLLTQLSRQSLLKFYYSLRKWIFYKYTIHSYIFLWIYKIRKHNFRRGILQSPVPIDTFKRISIKKDGCIIKTRTVKLKFVAPKIPSVIALFNVLYEVKPSICPPVQYNRCLRFGHTQKYCCIDPTCSSYGETKQFFKTYNRSTSPKTSVFFFFVNSAAAMNGQPKKKSKKLWQLKTYLTKNLLCLRKTTFILLPLISSML